MFSRIVLLALVATTVNAGFFDDVKGAASDVGNFFSSQFQNAKDLFASDQTTLEKNVQRVKDLLTAVKEKFQSIEPLASDAQKKTLGQVDNFLGQVNSFQNEVKQEGAAKFEENKTKWQQMVTDMFEKNGLGDIVKLLNLNSGSMYTCSALIVPIAYMLFR